MNLKTNLCNRNNYGGARLLSAIKYIVVHYTGNDGDTDESNANYFKQALNPVASAHYFVDDDSVTRTVPDDYIAWHCGANIYRHATCRNGNSIGVEICDDVRNGVVYPSTKTIENALELVKWLMEKYNVPKANVIRHYDVTGKLCPAYWCNSAEKDAKWKNEFWNRLDGTYSGDNSRAQATAPKVETSVKTDSSALYRVQVGAFKQKKNAQAKLASIEAAGFDAINIQVGDLWKVQVGAFHDKEKANVMMDKLKKAGFTAIVVKATEAKKTVTEIAREVISGKWGNGQVRVDKLKSAGYDPVSVQKEVNRLLR